MGPFSGLREEHLRRFVQTRLRVPTGPVSLPPTADPWLGTGFIVTGPYWPNGGTADVYLDGKLVKTVDVYPDEDSVKSGESVYHAFHLPAAQHTVRVVVRGEPYGGSKGTDIGIDGLVVFR